MRLLMLLVLGVVCAWAPNTTAAQSAIDPDASVVELRAPATVACPTCTGCETTPGNYLDNCFETTAALTDWLWGGLLPPAGRNGAPTSVDMVAVHVGPGQFDRFECVGAGQGWVSVIGAGRENTRFTPSNPGAADPDFPARCVGGIDVNGCTGLNFQDLTAQGYARAVNWLGVGASNWRDVDMIADGESQPPVCFNEGALPVYAWWDTPPWGTQHAGPHFFWDSRFTVRRPQQGGSYAQVPFASDLGGTESWFYGCDFLLDQNGGDTANAVDAALWIAGKAFIFGSTVRVRSPSGLVSAGASSVQGIFVSGSGVLHMHGGIINVNVAAQDREAIGILSASSNLVHTPGTAFNMRWNAPGGSTWRVKKIGSGPIQSPFQWPADTVAPDLFSEHGQDMFVKTDAGPGGDETRLFVYDTSCGTLWRDTTGSCL